VLHGNIHRHLLTLSLINWGIAIVCWVISAWLGISQPASIFIYTILFVVGLFAAIVAVLSFVLADFGSEPGVPAAEAAEPPSGDASGPIADTGA
jgi:hypothetical protein